MNQNQDPNTNVSPTMIPLTTLPPPESTLQTPQTIIKKTISRPPRSRQWSDLYTTDFATLDLNRVIAVLPLGATEQHGPHLPLSVDANLAHSIAQHAADNIPAEVPALFLPVMRLGYSVEHQDFAGTLSLSAETVMKVWTQTAESVFASGIRKLVLFNTHGGQANLLDPVARDLRARLGMLVYSINWYDLPLIDDKGQDIIQRIPEEERRFGVHGGQIETSMMLAIKPLSVKMQKARNFDSTSKERSAFEIIGNGKSAKFAWAARDLNPHGVAGNAAAAKAEDGLAIMDAAGKALAKAITEIDKLPINTIK